MNRMNVQVFAFLLVVLNFYDVTCAPGLKPATPFVEKCPKDWNHPKCTCETGELTNLATIQCKDITDPADIKSALAQQFTDGSHEFEWFTLEGGKLTSFGGDIFGESTFRGFIVTNATISDFSDDAFKGSTDTLRFFWITDSDFSGFNFKTLQGLQKLSSVSMLSCGLTDIPDNAFQNSPELERISLEKNDIQNIGLNNFASMPNLGTLLLSKNQLKEVKAGQLKLDAIKRPTEIGLANNGITSIEAGAFSDLAQPPSQLNLQNNQLQTLTEETFAPLLEKMKSSEKSTVINVAGNPIVCDASLDWLVQKRDEYKKLIKGLKCSDGRRPFEETNKV